MLTRFIKMQLAILMVVAAFFMVVLGWYYLRIPSLLGVGQYPLYADLPQSGGLYRTSNVTYRGVTIGRVTAVEPTRRTDVARHLRSLRAQRPPPHRPGSSARGA